MRQRVTILNHESNHDSIIKQLNSTYVKINDVNFTREDKFTINLESFEPSNEFAKDWENFVNALKNIDEFNIRIGSYESPVFNYNSVGDNINIQPLTNDRELFFQQIDEFSKLFDIKNNWISSRLSLFQHQENIIVDPFLKGIFLKEIKYDALNMIYFDNTLIISFVKKNDEDAYDGFYEVNFRNGSYTETGIFLIDDFSWDDIVLSGLRIIMDGDKPPEGLSDKVDVSSNSTEEEKDVKDLEGVIHKTLFHIKPRFRKLSTSTELVTNGLHPKLKTKFLDIPNDTDIKDCQSYYYINLPKLLFIDKYNPGKDVNIITNYGSQDLELPEYKINEWGNEILLEVNPDENNEVEILLHSRYQKPNSDNLITIRPIPIYGCNINDRNTLLSNPFINYQLGNYMSYFTNDTIFYQDLDNALLVEIPSPQSEFYGINLITTVSLLLGILIVTLQLLKPKPERRKKD